MKKIIKRGLLALSLCALLISPVQDIEARTYPLGLDSRMVKSTQEVLRDDLELLKELDQYRIDIRLRNQDLDQVLVEGYLLGDNEQGDLSIDLTYYYYDEEGKLQEEIPLSVRSYQQMGLVYVNQVELLDRMGVFDQADMPRGLSRALREYQDYYIALNSAELSHSQLTQDLLSSLLLIPHEEAIEELDEGVIEQVRETYLVAADRSEIPTGLFSNQAGFNFHLDLGFGLEALEEGASSLNTVINQRLDFSQNYNGIHIGFGLTSEYSSRLYQLYQSINEQMRGNQEADQPDLVQVSSLDSQRASNKMTNLSLSYNTSNQHYNLSLEGLAEDFHLNFFDESTANFSHYTYQLSYQLYPVNQSPQALADLQRLSNEEFKYIVNLIVNEP